MKYSEEPGRQYHIGTTPDETGDYVILTGDPKRCVKIAEYLEDPQKIADVREYVTYTGKLEGEMVSVVSTGIGGPSASIAVEEMVRCGAHTFIRIGTCGGINTDVKSGDLVIATAAVRQEGTSREYAPIEFPAAADFEVISALKDAASDIAGQGVSSHIGVVQSKDSFYGQHEPEKMPVSYELMDKWEAWKRLGVKASEMECAAIFTVGNYLNVRTGAVLLVMANQEREKAGLENPVVHDTDAAVRTAVAAMRKLILNDRNK